MNHYAGIDVSLECSSVCVVDANGKILREARVASEPEALIAWFRSSGFDLERIGLEAGPLSQWLLRRCGKQDWQSNCWRRGMCARRSRRCR